jgi:hypothetical protein
MEQLWRGQLISVERLGNDVRMELAPEKHDSTREAA